MNGAFHPHTTAFALGLLLSPAVGIFTAVAQDDDCHQPPHFFANSVASMDFTTVDPNGHLFGWVMPPGQGQAAAHISSDGDWNIEVLPETPPSGFQSNIAANTAEDIRRQNIIECEICDKCASLLHNRIPIETDQVQLDGIHVLDNGHASKTEIHPITGMTISEMGASRPRPGEETFRIVVGAGGSCPQGILRTVSPFPQSTNALVTLSWPAPPISTTSVFNPAFVITELTNGTPQIVSIDLGGGPLPRIQIPRDGSFTGLLGADRFPVTVTRSGSTATMAIIFQEAVGRFDTSGRVFHINTKWDPEDVKVLVDGVTDRHIIADPTVHPFLVRRYEVRAHIDPAADVTWYLHSGANGYSTPGPQLLGAGPRLIFNYDIAPAHRLDTYSFSIEARNSNGLSVFSSPIHLPHPSIGIQELADVETCQLESGGQQERHVSITLAARTANFASGPNISWTLAPDPLPPGQPPLTFSGPQITHEFVISRASQQSKFTARAEASDLDGVESASSEGDEELLNFQPTAILYCQRMAFPKYQLSVMTSGTCGALHYRWYTGETTDTIMINNASVDPIQAGVSITDDAGQSIDLLNNVCGISYIEQQRLKLISSVDLLGKLLLASKLIPTPEPPGPAGPDASPATQLWDIAKSMSMTASAAPPEIIGQRIEFIQSIVSQVTKAPRSAQGEILRKLAEQRVSDARSGKYTETRRVNVAIPSFEWNEENAKEADARAKEMEPRIRARISR
jgi:hypothetical protein